MDNDKKDDFMGLISAGAIIFLFVLNLIFDKFDFQIDKTNPIYGILLMALLIGGGVLFILKGMKGIKEERIVWKFYSSPMHGKAAQVMGFLYVIVGILLSLTFLVLVITQMAWS